MNLKERILVFIEYKGIDKATFERQVGLSNDAVNKMGDNTRKSTIDKISNTFPDINPVWLKMGVGEMIKTGDISVKGDNNTSNTGVVGGNITGGNSDLMKKIVDLEKEVIKLLGELATKDAKIEGLRNELAIKTEMITFLQSKK